MSRRRGAGKFLLGAGIGIGLGMLLSKKSGEENRKELKRKIDDLISKVKEIDSEEVKKNIESKINEIISEIKDLDKEKALKIAKKKAEQIKIKSEELVEYAMDKGPIVLEKSAAKVREKAIIVTKDILKKLEQEEK